jgi:hypothetical protein
VLLATCSLELVDAAAGPTAVLVQTAADYEAVMQWKEARARATLQCLRSRGAHLVLNPYWFLRNLFNPC